MSLLVLWALGCSACILYAVVERHIALHVSGVPDHDPGPPAEQPEPEHPADRDTEQDIPVHLEAPPADSVPEVPPTERSHRVAEVSQ